MDSSTGSLVSGMMFGTALTISGVASPQVIRDQFRLSDYHMLVTLLTASASSAATFLIYNARMSSKDNDDQKIPVRPIQQNMSLISKYDTHIAGGAMVGLGMALTGACPGTVLVQATAGIGNSRLIALSSLVAGLVFAKWKRSLKSASVDQQPRESIMTATGLSANKAVLIYDSLILATIPVVLVFASRSRTLVHPVVGGLMIGLSQFASVKLAGKAIGVSGAYGDAGEAFWDIMDGRRSVMKQVPHSIRFALALIMGAKLTMLMIPEVTENLAPLRGQSMMSALIGGFLLTFGSRLAGGCTSGHGISGMALMSLSSFVTVGSMFGSGILSSFLFL